MKQYHQLTPTERAALTEDERNALIRETARTMTEKTMRRATSKPRKSAFDRWIDRFLSEKGIDLEETFDVEGREWGTNTIPVGVIVEHMKIAPPHEQAAIKTMLVKIDFANGDVRRYLKHLAGAIAR